MAPTGAAAGTYNSIVPHLTSLLVSKIRSGCATQKWRCYGILNKTARVRAYILLKALLAAGRPTDTLTAADWPGWKGFNLGAHSSAKLRLRPGLHFYVAHPFGARAMYERNPSRDCDFARLRSAFHIAPQMMAAAFPRAPVA